MYIYFPLVPHLFLGFYPSALDLSMNEELSPSFNFPGTAVADIGWQQGHGVGFCRLYSGVK